MINKGSPGNRIDQTLPICPYCGTVIPLAAQLNFVATWRWRALLAVLLGTLPAFKCPRCQRESDIPVVTGFLSERTGHMLIHIAEPEKGTLINQFENYLLEKQEPQLRVETTDSLARLQEVIGEHVLSFKPFLKELGQASQRNTIDQFVDQHWHRLTPDVLAAGLVGFTGLVKHIGGYVVDQQTGKTLEFTKAFHSLEEFFADIQFKVWLRIIANRWTASERLGDTLVQHIRDGGIFGGNAKELGNLLKHAMKDLSQDKDWLSPLGIHTLLALHARVSHVEKLENLYADLWAHEYFQLELAVLRGPVEGSDDFLTHWQIDGSEAAATIPETQAWNALSKILNPQLSPRPSETFEQYESRFSDLVRGLEKVTERLGYADLAKRVLGAAQASFRVPAKDHEFWDTFFRSLNSLDASQVALTAALHHCKEALLKGGMEAVEKAFDFALAKVGRDLEQRAGVEAWFGECAKLLSSPKSFLDRIGEEPRDWESGLSLERRICLWNERANAFRLLGQQDRALNITDALLDESQDHEELNQERRVLLRNRAILLREVGAVDAALRQLSDLLEDCALEERAGLLESYASTCVVLGRHEEAIDSLQQALRFTEAPERAKLLALLAMEYPAVDRSEEALQILKELAGSERDFSVAAVLAAAYSNLLHSGVELVEEDLDRFYQLIRALAENLEQAEGRGDVHHQTQVLSMMGHLMFAVKPEASEPIWRQVLDLRAKNKKHPDPVALARLATMAYLRKQRDEVDSLLRLLPAALIEEFGQIEDVSTGFGAANAVCPAFHELMRVAIDQKAPWSDIRRISELTRDTIGRAKLIRSRKVQDIDRSLLERGITDENVATLAKPQQPMAVLEWGGVDQQLFAMLTTVDTDGGVRTEPIEGNNLNFFDLRSRVMHRLSVWHSRRAGDPFDFAGWSELERWLQAQVEQRLDDGRHLVVIDHEALVGLPWHVALAPRWHCSYAPSWTSLLREATGHTDDPVRVGVFAAPRYKDAPAIREAFSRSVASTLRWTMAKGYPCDVYKNESADREAFERLMAECRVVKLLCHGYASPEDHEIALLISYAGTLPPLYAPGDPKLLDANRLSWRDLQSLSRAAPLVLSAACSTGLQWQAGAGEQMGLFGALQQAGTRSLIAPRWEVEAEAVVPLLDEILVRYFNEKVTLVEALHQTCLVAQARLPKWLAWSLSLEGDWR